MTPLPGKTSGRLRAGAADSTLSTRSKPQNRHQGRTNETALDEAHAAALKLLRFPDVRERTGLSRSTIWRLERQGAFPRHHRISANAVAWIEDDIATWIRSKVSGIAF
jgi:prophage regulatory protein